MEVDVNKIAWVVGILAALFIVSLGFLPRLEKWSKGTTVIGGLAVSFWLVGGIVATAGWGIASLSGSSAVGWRTGALLMVLSAVPLSAIAAIQKRCYHISWLRSVGAIMITFLLALLTAFLMFVNGLMPKQLFVNYYRTHYPQLEPCCAGDIIAMDIMKTVLVFGATLLVCETTVPLLVYVLRRVRQKQP